jgi:hypothetical protein
LMRTISWFRENRERAASPIVGRPPFSSANLTIKIER